MEEEKQKQWIKNIYNMIEGEIHTKETMGKEIINWILNDGRGRKRI